MLGDLKNCYTYLMKEIPGYITHRLLPDWVRQAAVEYDISVTSFSDDWVHRLEKNGTTRFVHGYRFDLNASAAGSNAHDKVATSLLLQDAGLPVVSHLLLDSAPSTYPCVIKPLHGTGGNGVVLIESAQSYEAWRQDASPAQYALSPLELVEAEYRAIILDGQALLVYEKVRQIKDPFPLYNLGQGATPVLVTTSSREKIAAIAVSAATVLGLRISAVDIIRTGDGYKVLEVNDGIMMEYFARHSEENRLLARDIYAKIVAAMF